MKWTKIIADNFSELRIGDRVTKENNVELLNVVQGEPMITDNVENNAVYIIIEASAAPEKIVRI